MRFEDLKRGHWIAIAIVAGAALAWLQSSSSGGGGMTQTHSQTAMETLLYRPPMKGSDGSQYPWIRAIKIYPAAEAGFAMKRPEGVVVPRKSTVTFEVLTPAPQEKGWQYRPATTLVEEPFRAAFGSNSGPPQTVAQYIGNLAKDRTWIQYHYAWWHEPRWMYALWIGGCVLVMGIIWPTVQDRLILAGYGARSERTTEKRAAKGESFWKRWFTRAPQTSRPSSSAVAQASSMTLSQDELDRIAKMEEGLNDFVKGGDQEPGGEVDETKPPEIRTLNAEPLNTAPPPEAPKEDKDYGGEFYPTVAHGKKKPDNKP